MDEKPAPFVLRLHLSDDVVIARQQLVDGMQIKAGVRVRGLIPPGHKVAIRDIAQGEAIRRYGQIIFSQNFYLSHLNYGAPDGI
jgi:altronate hydrolase